MPLPAHQRAAYVAGTVLTALLLVGSALDTLSNAITWFTPAVAIVGTVVVLLATATLHFVLRRRPVRWVVNGQTTRITALGPTALAVALGLIGLLWLPRAIAYLTTPVDRTTINWVDLLWRGDTHGRHRRTARTRSRQLLQRGTEHRPLGR